MKFKVMNLFQGYSLIDRVILFANPLRRHMSNIPLAQVCEMNKLYRFKKDVDVHYLSKGIL